MTQDTILISVSTIIGILYIYRFYRLYKKLRTFPNHMIVGVGLILMLLLGLGLFKLITRGVPAIIDVVTKQESHEQQPPQPATSGDQQSGTTIPAPMTGIIGQSGDALFSGLNANATEEEVVSWSTLRDKLKHVEVTEKHGSPAGSGSAQ